METLMGSLMGTWIGRSARALMGKREYAEDPITVAACPDYDAG